MGRLRRAWRDLGPLGAVVALIAGIGLLPPDTALDEVRAAGILRACVPESYPPFVTAEAARPGIEVEILRAVAGRLGVGLGLNRLSAMGRDFNPRNWRLTRASCMVVAGGLPDTDLTRSFLDTTTPYAASGWAMVGRAPLPAGPEGAAVGVLVATSGLDRIALSSWLRAAGVRPRLFTDRDEFAAALASGEVALGITDALLAGRIAAAAGLAVAPAGAGGLARFDIAFGLWKGDLTLKRAIEAALADLRRSGEIEAILARYLDPGAG